ncbi:SAM-dependent methyltransferase [Longirhabdus pacifica]|uniref:SAM-dependent methyltransferase n=1 Tax=Longirhabdus pacifica TaxID=2305227 RepID=UPI001009165C|nr:class I SAM-dependent methyltransferase [Longirhabdus pacifica]
MKDERWKDFFDETYASFSEVILTPERTVAECEAIIDCLQLQTGDHVLDFGCGQGRMSIPLAERGMTVTGYDGSPTLLEEAKRRAPDLPHLHFQLGDMRELDESEQYDAIINIGTAFGYVPSREEDEHILQRVYAALKPGGYFLQELENRENKIKQLYPTWNVMHNNIVFSRRQFDLTTSRWSEEMFWFEEQEKKQAKLELTLYTASELMHMTTSAGLQVQHIYGGLDRSSYHMDSPRLMILSQKK